MGGIFLETLSWLQQPPKDFGARLNALASDSGRRSGADLALLASFAMDLDQLAHFARVIDRVSDRLDPAPLSPIRLAVLADGTTEYLMPAIRASAPRHGLLASVYTPAYGQAMHEVMSPEHSGLAVFGPDVVLLASDHRSLGLASARVDSTAAYEAVAAAVGRITALVNGVERMGATVILQTVPIPTEPWCGHLDRRVPGAPTSQITAFNDAIARLADERKAVLLDAAALADGVGRARWFDDAYWHRAKIPFRLDLVPLYADHVTRLLGALRGKSRKCLVLDLDNTCWGGVIGDDGLDGIKVGQGSADGEAFLAIQAYALALKERGIVLGVVSKNEDDAARLPFQKHPDMLLREDDIAVFIANWNDKATNIKHVATTLNIGVDSLVFLDDNPAERARVRQMLPEVAVPELPDDPAGYPFALAHSGLFETVGLSADDSQRAEQYKANAARAVALEQIGDYEVYLKSLEMTCDIRQFDEDGRTRIAQLINKSNQFNLTTRRYTEPEVAAMRDDPQIFDLQVRLVDKFGDNGMISVVIFRKEPEQWICDTWLMSCRVLGRRVEEAALAAVALAARSAGVRRLIGEYLPTAKNRMVENHFAKLGFCEAGPVGKGGTRWVLELASYEPPSLPMRITGMAVEPS